MKKNIGAFKLNSNYFVVLTALSILIGGNAWALTAAELIAALKSHGAGRTGIPLPAGVDPDFNKALKEYLEKEKSYQVESKKLADLKKELSRLQEQKETGQNAKGSKLNKWIGKSTLQKDIDNQISILEKKVKTQEKNSDYIKARNEFDKANLEVNLAAGRITDKYDGKPTELESQLLAQYKAITNTDYLDPSAPPVPAPPAPRVPAPPVPVPPGGPAPAPRAPGTKGQQNNVYKGQITDKPTDDTLKTKGSYLADEYVQKLTNIMNSSTSEEAKAAAKKALEFNDRIKAGLDKYNTKDGSLMFKAARVAWDLHEYTKTPPAANVLQAAKDRAKYLAQRIDARVVGGGGGLPPPGPGAPGPVPVPPGGPAPVPGPPAPVPGAPKTTAEKLAALKDKKVNADAKIKADKKLINDSASLEADIRTEITKKTGEAGTLDTAVKRLQAVAAASKKEGDIRAYYAEKEKLDKKQQEIADLNKALTDLPKSIADATSRVVENQNFINGGYRNQKRLLEVNQSHVDEVDRRLAGGWKRADFESKPGDFKTEKVYYKHILSDLDARVPSLKTIETEVSKIQNRIDELNEKKRNITPPIEGAKLIEQFAIDSELTTLQTNLDSKQKQLDETPVCFTPTYKIGPPKEFSGDYSISVGKTSTLLGSLFTVGKNESIKALLTPDSKTGAPARMEPAFPKSGALYDKLIDDEFKEFEKASTANEQAALAKLVAGGTPSLNLVWANLTKDVLGKKEYNDANLAGPDGKALFDQFNTILRYANCTTYPQFRKYIEEMVKESKEKQKENELVLNALDVMTRLEQDYKDLKAIEDFIAHGKRAAIKTSNGMMITGDKAEAELQKITNRVIKLDDGGIADKETGLKYSPASGGH